MYVGRWRDWFNHGFSRLRLIVTQTLTFKWINLVLLLTCCPPNELNIFCSLGSFQTWKPVAIVSKENICTIDMFAKVQKLEPHLHSLKLNFHLSVDFYSVRERADITKCTTLMIDLYLAKHLYVEWPLCPLLCYILSSNCLRSHHPLQLPYSIISTGGLGRVGSRLTFH